MKDVKAGSVSHRPFVGLGRDGLSRFGDTAATICDVRSTYDYTVATADYHRAIVLPTPEEVAEEVELDKARGTRDLERFLFWEDHSDETPHPETVTIRKFRQMVFQRTIGKDLVQADRNKYRHYGELGIVPISFTARGSMGRHSVVLVDTRTGSSVIVSFSALISCLGSLLSCFVEFTA